MAVGEFTGDSEQGEKSKNSLDLRNLLRTSAVSPAAPSKTLLVCAFSERLRVDSCVTLPLSELSSSN